MSDQNTGGFPFSEDLSGEGVDIDAIFGGGTSGSDTNPFAILMAQQAEPAAPAAQPQTVKTPAVPISAETPQTASLVPAESVSSTKTPQSDAPEDNLISAAIAKQETAVVQTAAKSLFEKAPVFFYGSARASESPGRWSTAR